MSQGQEKLKSKETHFWLSSLAQERCMLKLHINTGV